MGSWQFLAALPRKVDVACRTLATDLSGLSDCAGHALAHLITESCFGVSVSVCVCVNASDFSLAY